MKYLKLFEEVGVEFKVGDIVKFSVDKLRVHNYELTDLEKMVYYRVTEIHRIINKEIYYSVHSKQTSMYFNVVFANEIEKLSEYELDAIRYNI